MEDYLTEITDTTQQLADIGKEIDDESIGAIMLGGLTSRYDPLIMALENLKVQISSEMIKSKLLNEMTSSSVEELVKTVTEKKFWKKKPERSKKKAEGSVKREVVCFHCIEPGHIKPRCPKLKKCGETSEVKVNYSLFTDLSANMISDSWYIDSSASAHITSSKGVLQNVSSAQAESKVTVANNEKFYSEGSGTIYFSNSSCQINSITDVVYVPNLNANLISVSKAVEKGFTVMFNSAGCSFYRQDTCKINGNVILSASLQSSMYKLDLASVSREHVSRAESRRRAAQICGI